MNYIIDQMLEDLENEMNGRDVQYFFWGMPETEVSKEIFTKGAIFVKPVDSSIIAVTTGITDEEVHSIEIIVAKSMQTKVYRNAQQETGEHFLAKVMDGRDSGNDLLKDTIRYVVRSHLQDYGIRQPAVSIVYDDDRVGIQGVVTATMTITQEEHYSQAI